MRKGVANLLRYRDISLAANKRYLEALAVVDDPGIAFKQLDAITKPKRTRAGQSVKAFNPLNMEDQRIFKALLAGATPSVAFVTGTFASSWQVVHSSVPVGTVWPSSQLKCPGY